MARLVGLVCLVFVGLMLMAGTAVTQEKKGTKAKTPLPKGFKDLGLSPEQDAQMRRLMSEFDGKVKKLQDEIKSLKQQETTELTKLLTPEQRERLTKILLGDDSKRSEVKKESK